MIITKEELKGINVAEQLENVNFIKIKNGRHTIFNVNDEIKVTEHDGLRTLPNNKIPKYIKQAIIDSLDENKECLQ